MIRAINRIFVLFLCAAAAVLVVISNRSAVTFRLSDELVWSSSLGVLVLIVFCLGIVCATALAAVFAVRNWWIVQGLNNKLSEVQDFKQRLRRVFLLRAQGDLPSASQELFSMQRTFKSDLYVGTLLISNLLQEQKYNEALEVLDELRSKAPNDPSLLLLAFDIYKNRGNATAALDMLTSSGAVSGSLKQLQEGLILAIELKSLERALQIQREIQENYPNAVGIKEGEARIEFLRLSLEAKGDWGRVRDKLDRLGSTPSAPAECLEVLAKLNEKEKKAEPSALYWQRLAFLTLREEHLEYGLMLLVHSGQPDRAIALAKRIVRDASPGKQRLMALQAFVRLLLILGNYDYAMEMVTELKNASSDDHERKAVEAIEALAKLSQSLSRNEVPSARSLLEKLLRRESIENFFEQRLVDVPSPRLSTP